MTRCNVWIGCCLLLGGLQIGGGCGSGATARQEQVAPKEPEKFVARQVVAIDWVFEERRGDKTLVLLAMTDETGAAGVRRLGEFDGPCREVSAEGTRAILAAVCEHPRKGSALRIRRYGFEIILLRAPIAEADDEMSYEEKVRLPIPTGAEVRARE